MYTQHFDLTEEPFSIAANPRFLYMSARHREALAHLLYGIRSDSGFVMLTGDVGTGKTTVCRCLMEQLPEQSNVAFILNPKVTVIELLSSICDEFGIDYANAGSSVKSFVDAINRYLLAQHAQGRNTVIIIDEAQNLSTDVLEQLRLLTNLETNERKLVRIILLGQPELELLLSRPELKQVEQRITARYTLQPLDRGEINAYVSHRLAVAGCRKPVFSQQVINKIYAKTGGTPRLINILCDRAMLGAYVKARHKVTPGILNEAAKEVQGRPHQHHWFQNRLFALSSVLAGALALVALLYTNADQVFKLLPQPSEAQAVDKITALADSTSAPETQVGVIDEEAYESTEPVDQQADSAMPGWPDNVSATIDTQVPAHAMLFKQWNKELDSYDPEPCVQAMTWGLRCYSGTGNLGILFNNDRPAILTLLDTEGRQFQATLLALNDEQATVAFAHGIETVALNELDAHWQGHYKLLWRMNPEGLSIFRPGETGSGINWLTKSLIAAGIESLTQKDHYDAEVIEAVKAFQRQRGLLADGIAGRQTLMHLNSIHDTTIPRLSGQGEG